MRRAYIEISTKFLSDIMGMPDDVNIIAVEQVTQEDRWRHTFRVYLEGGCCPEVKEGDIVQRMNAVCTRDTDGRTRTIFER